MNSKSIIICSFIAIFISFSFSFSASVELGISAGYGFDAGSRMSPDGGMFPDAEFDGNVNPLTGDVMYNEYRDVYTSLGNGLKLNLDVTIFFNDNFGLLIGSGFSTLGGINVESVVNNGGDKYIRTTKIKANHLPINLGFKLKSEIGKFVPYIYLAPGIYIPIGVKDEDVYRDETSTGIDEDTYDGTMKFAPGFGVAAGLGAAIKFSDVVGLTFEFAPTYAFARLTEYEYVTTLSDGSKYTYTVIFKKNEGKLPDDETTLYSETEYEHGGPNITFSSLAAKLGIVLCF